MERCVISLTDGGGSRRHGAVGTRRPMHGDELTQEVTRSGVVVASTAARPGKVDAAVLL